ncbi:MAG: ion channel [Pseudomonadota bacterium]
MLLQLILGSVLIVGSAVFSAVLWWLHEVVHDRASGWLRAPPHVPKLLVHFCLTILWMLVMITVAVWMWALAFWWLALFSTMEASVYFALVAFTTLGFGDVLLPEGWRLLSGICAANGFLLFGLITARFVELMRETRLMQRDYWG